MVKYFSVVLVLISFYSSAQEMDSFKHYPIDINSNKIDFFSLIDGVDIIRFEESEHSLLSMIESYLSLPDGQAIIDMKSNQILLYDKKGDFKNAINKHGGGPNEYQGISSAWVRGDKIELFSGNSRSLSLFSLDGNYLETNPVKYSKDLLGGTMIPVKEGYLMHLLSPSMYEKAEYSLVKLNYALEPVLKIESNINPNPFPLNLGKRFGLVDGNVFYKKVLSDSLFLIENGKIIPKMKFDFGTDWVWVDDQNVSSIRAASDAATKSEKIVEVLPDVGKKYIMISYLSGFLTKKKGYALINRLNDKVIHLDLRKSNKENFEVFFIEWQEGQLIASLPVYDLEEFISNLSESQYKIVGGYDLEEIMASENPVLLKIKFK